MKVVIYTKPNCPWCVKAKELAKNLHLDYEEKRFEVDFTKEELREKMNLSEWERLFLPQVFINDKHIGGYEEFAEYCEATGIMGIQN